MSKKSTLTSKQNRFKQSYVNCNNVMQAEKESGLTLSHSRGNSFYVYFLVDPRDHTIFYVGKGIRQRAHQHLRNKKNISLSNNLKKAKRIKDIRDSGQEPYVRFIATGLTESQAFYTEVHLIHSFKNNNLTNLIGLSGRNSAMDWAQAALSELKSPIQLKSEGRPNLILKLAEKIRLQLTEIANNGIVEGYITIDVNGKSITQEIRRF
jgi:hypothetical protein